MIITVITKHTAFVIDNPTIGVKQIKSYIIFNVVSNVVIENNPPNKTLTKQRNYVNWSILLAILL